ncbi:MAG: Oxidoreductase, GMC family, partial [uncultured Acetobacteraceae bacterium]
GARSGRGGLRDPRRRLGRLRAGGAALRGRQHQGHAARSRPVGPQPVDPHPHGFRPPLRHPEVRLELPHGGRAGAGQPADVLAARQGHRRLRQRERPRLPARLAPRLRPLGAIRRPRLELRGLPPRLPQAGNLRGRRGRRRVPRQGRPHAHRRGAVPDAGLPRLRGGLHGARLPPLRRLQRQMVRGRRAQPAQRPPRAALEPGRGLPPPRHEAPQPARRNGAAGPAHRFRGQARGGRGGARTRRRGGGPPRPARGAALRRRHREPEAPHAVGRRKRLCVAGVRPAGGGGGAGGRAQPPGPLHDPPRLPHQARRHAERDHGQPGEGGEDGRGMGAAPARAHDDRRGGGQPLRPRAARLGGAGGAVPVRQLQPGLFAGGLHRAPRQASRLHLQLHPVPAGQPRRADAAQHGPRRQAAPPAALPDRAERRARDAGREQACPPHRFDAALRRLGGGGAVAGAGHAERRRVPRLSPRRRHHRVPPLRHQPHGRRRPLGGGHGAARARRARAARGGRLRVPAGALVQHPPGGADAGGAGGGDGPAGGV